MHDIGLDAGNADDGDAIGRLAQLDDDISRTIDLKCGRSFGGTADDEVARVITLPVSGGNTILVLPYAIRSVSSIAFTGDHVETLAADEYVLTLGTELTGDYHGIRMIHGGLWPANTGRTTLTITGQWSMDAVGGTIPDEIRAAATFLVVEEWRLRASSPAGEIGPDGMMVRPRNPWGFEIVKTALDHYSVAQSMAGF